MTAAHLDGNELVNVLGVTATWMIFLAPIFILFGLFFPVLARRMRKEAVN